MANPQKENGYTPIAHELLEAMAKTNFTPKQSRCLFFLLRKTYGWGKKQTQVKTKEWVEGTGMHKQHAYAALRELIARNVVTRIGDQYGIQKDYTRWREVTGIGYGNGTRLQNRSRDKVTSTYKNNIIDREVTRSRYQKNKSRGYGKDMSPHPSTKWPECPKCGQSGPSLRIVPDVGCNLCKPMEVE